MKINRNISKVIYLTIAFISGLAILINPCFSKEAKKVAVLPFIMNAQEDLTFLQKGIFDMFSSRVSYGDEVEVLTRESLEDMLKNAVPPFSITRGVNESKAKELGKYLNVDYVLFGSLTIFGNSMSLDVNMVDIKNNIPALTFFRQAKEAGAVIPELDKISEEINFKVFGREIHQFQPLNTLQREYLSSQGGDSYSSPLVKPKNLLTVDRGINGIAVGDVDGDNKNEVVVVYDRAVEIFKYSVSGKLLSIKKFEKEAVTLKIIGVDVADINNNGYAEIFVTRIKPDAQQVKSYIIEYDGSKFVSKPKIYPWYFRVIKNSKGVGTLYAQGGSPKGPFVPKRVFKAEWMNQAYSIGQTLRVPKGFSVMSLAMGKMENKKQGYSVFTDKLGRLTFFNDAGQVEWSDDEGYGGSKLYFPMATINKIDDKDLVFFQPKNILFDVDSDGDDDLVVIKNNENSDYLMKNLRTFKTGQIEIMEWNELGLSPSSAPRKLPGQISCIEIGDYDNDSKVELLVTLIKKKSGYLTKAGKSQVIAYDL